MECRRRAQAIVFAFSLLLCFPLATDSIAQQLPSTTPEGKPSVWAAISGKVLRAETGEPLSGARVNLQSASQGESEDTTTDGQGRFSFERLQAGTYFLEVRRAGYVGQFYGQGQRNPSGVPLALSPGQQVRDLVFSLSPAGVITGRVSDTEGNPLEEVEVVAWKIVVGRGGERRSFSQQQDMTDDRGEYRIHGLEAGTYIVSAYAAGTGGLIGASDGPKRPGLESSQPSPREVAGRTYYPGTLYFKEAALIELHPGQELSGIDIRVLSVRVFSVRGKVVGPDGARPLERVSVSLSPRDGSEDAGFAHANVSPDGTFEIRDVRPGDYQLTATMGDSDEKGTSGATGEVEVSIVNGDVENLLVSLVRGAEISGRARIEGSPNPPQRFFVGLISRDVMGFTGAEAKPDGSFVIKNVRPGTYAVHGQVGRDENQEFYLKEVRLGGQDVRRNLQIAPGVSLSGLEVIFANDGGTISGMVLDEDNLPAAGAYVFLFMKGPAVADPSASSAQADQLGRFQMKAIRPGEYRILAMMPSDALDWGKTEELLAKYEKKVKTLRVDPRGQYTLQLEAVVPEGKQP